MKKVSGFVFIVFAIQLVFLSSCKEKENESPLIEIISPVDETIIMQGDQLLIEVTASDPDGSVDEVWFYIDYVLAESLYEPPYEFLWTGSDTMIGDVIVRATVYDNEGKAAASNITVVVDAIGGFNPDLSYGSMVDYDGNTYKTIEIGEQKWMAENLKVTHYADGTPIPLVSDDDEWAALGEGSQAYCWYDNMSEYGDTTGALYSWGGAMNGSSDSSEVVQGVCPDGWHLPGDEEWKVLEMQLGMSQEAADGLEWRGSSVGAFLKEQGFSHWDNPNSGADNASGFTALGGGFRSNKGTFYGVREYATFWSSDEKTSSANSWYRVLHFEKEAVYRHYITRKQGLSVRCVEDK